MISLDAVKCEALSSLSLGNYLEFVYSGCLPAFEVVSGVAGVVGRAPAAACQQDTPSPS